MSDLATPLQYLKGVGPRRAADLSHAGLLTVEDLLYRFPLRYEDRSRLQSIASLKPGRAASLAGRILSCGLRSTRRPGFKIFDAVVDDGTASIRVSWLNQAFLRDVFAAGQHVVLFGPVEMRGSGGLQLTNPQYEILDEDDAQTVHTGRIVPVYEQTGSVTPKMQRRLVYDALQSLSRRSARSSARGRAADGSSCPSRYAALLASHFPPVDTPIDALNRFATPAQQRLIFEEAFLFQTGVLARRRPRAAERKAVVPTVDDRIRESARRVLPFKLTAGQKQALKEIVDDLQRPHPMNRLLQGDVGAGKTIVALLAGARRDGKRPAGRVHGADRDPRRAALPEHLAAAAAVALPRRAADGRDVRGGATRPARRGRSRADASRHRHACAGARATCASTSSGWW